MASNSQIQVQTRFLICDICHMVLWTKYELARHKESLHPTVSQLPSVPIEPSDSAREDNWHQRPAQLREEPVAGHPLPDCDAPYQNREALKSITDALNSSTRINNPRALRAPDEPLLTLTHKCLGSIGDTVGYPAINGRGRIECSVTEFLRTIEARYSEDMSFISAIKLLIKERLCRQYGRRIIMWRDKGRNLILYPDSPATELEILALAHFTVGDKVLIRLKPALEKAQYDFRYYKLRFNLDYHISMPVAMRHISQLWQVKEFIIGDSAYGDDGILTAYVTLRDCEEIESLGNEVHIQGYRCKMSHPYLHRCTRCNRQGHWEDNCLEIAQAANRLRTILQYEQTVASRFVSNSMVYRCELPQFCTLLQQYEVRSNTISVQLHDLDNGSQTINIPYDTRSNKEPEELLCEKLLAIRHFHFSITETITDLKFIKPWRVLNTLDALISIKKQMRTANSVLCQGPRNHNTKIKVAHLNVRGLRAKADYIHHMLSKSSIDVFGLCETLLSKNTAPPPIGGYTWFGNNGTNHARGVGFYVNNRLKAHIDTAWHADDDGRLIAITIDDVTLIEAYAPVNSACKQDKDEFFHDLSRMLAFSISHPRHTVIMGDFNAHIAGWQSDLSNENGHMLLNLLRNTNIELIKHSHLTYHTTGKKSSCLDYFAVSSPFKNRISHPYAVSDSHVPSDHIPLAVTIDLNDAPHELPQHRLTAASLKHQRTAHRFRSNLTENLIFIDPDSNASILYKQLTAAISHAIDHTPGIRRPSRRFVLSKRLIAVLKQAKEPYHQALKHCLTGDLQGYATSMIEHRRLHKKFKFLLRIEKTERAKRRLSDQTLYRLRDSWALRKVLLTRNKRKPPMLNPSEQEDILNWWSNTYDAPRQIWHQITPDNCPITFQEMSRELESLGNNKAPGPDKITAELLKCIGTPGKKILFLLIKSIWNSGEIPEDMKKAYVVLIPKTNTSKAPQDLRPITLVNTIYKLLDKIINTRLQRDLADKKIMHSAQAGFLPGKCCQDQIFTLNTLISLQAHKNAPTYCAYLDLSKAFDSVNRKILFDTMFDRNVDPQLIRILQAMYSGEKSAIVFNGKPSQWIDIKKGVRQGGCSSPTCFNILPNELAWTIDRSPYGIDIGNGHKVGILLYADDIVLIAPTLDHLKGLCKITSDWLSRYDLRLNANKSEIVTYGKQCKPKITIAGQQVNSSNSYKYLGYHLGSLLRSSRHLKDREGKMNAAVRHTLYVINALRNIPISQKMVIANSCIDSVALYGTETTHHVATNECILSRMDTLQRSYARKLLGATRAAANETILLDLGLIPIKVQADLRLLRFRARLRQSKSSILACMLTLNKRHNLPWEIRCNELLNQYGLSDITVDNTQSQIKIASNRILDRYRLCALQALNSKVTTILYRQLMTDPSHRPLYLSTFGSSRKFVQILYKIRAGDGYTNLNRHLRHLTTDPHCPHCPDIDEDEQHLLDLCPAYALFRLNTITSLKRLLPYIPHNLALSSFLLGTSTLEKNLSLMLPTRTINLVLRTCEDFLLQVHTSRSRALKGDRLN